MKRILFMGVWLSLCIQVWAQSNELQKLYIRAIQAQQQGNNAAFYDLIEQARARQPHHPGILYQAGIAATLNNKKAEAIGYLREAILLQADFALRIPELRPLREEPAFTDLLALQDAANKTVIHADTAFTLPNRAQHVTGICAGKTAGEFYLASIHQQKIIRVLNGQATDFTTTGQDSLAAVFDVQVDARKNILWACTSPVSEMARYNPELPGAVYQYDLKTGHLLAKYKPENPRMEVLLGDLTVDAKGTVYVADRQHSFIFRVNEESGKLEQFFSADTLRNLQGITCSDDGKYLYLSDFTNGLFRLDVSRRWLTPIGHVKDIAPQGIEGLAYYEHALICIQNGVKPMRVVRYRLNETDDQVTSYRVLDQRHPAFDEPTLGCVVGNAFYYIANSPWANYDEHHQLPADNKTQPIVVLKTKLGD